MQALSSLASSTAKSAKAWSDSTTVWTTTWPLWSLQGTDHRSLAMSSGYEPPLLWLRHDRTPLKGQVRVMLNGTVLYHSLRTAARETSADTPLVMAPGCGRRLSKQEGSGLLIETIELRELPGYPGHTASVQVRVSLSRSLPPSLPPLTPRCLLSLHSRSLGRPVRTPQLAEQQPQPTKCSECVPPLCAR